MSLRFIFPIYSVGIITGLGVTLVLLFHYEMCVNEYVEETRRLRQKLAEADVQSPPTGYLVNSPSCKIPNLNPFDLSTSKFVRRRNRTELLYSRPPLTELQFNPVTEETYLKLRSEAMKFYTNESALYCCITAVHETRLSLRPSRCDYLPDTTWILHRKFQLSVVSCYDSGRSLVYENLHATVVVTKRSGRRRPKSKRNGLNVLVLGLDSVSRLNLYRTMPLTVTHLHTRGWTELRGYTKVADNTLPNLMALLAGVPPDMLQSVHRRFFDGYPFIWKEFAAAGYVTAYVEDNPSLGTFSCHLKGFSRKPTDYYPQNFFVLAENYKEFRKNESFLGFKSSSDHLFGYLLDFARAHSRDPFFGFFWVNDFSHNDLNGPSSEDGRVLETLQSLEQLGTLNTTMVLFVSDHGLRVGEFRKTRVGWYEDRLPFLFLSLPERYKSQNLLDNSDRLTSPFDLYKTLSHVLHGDAARDPLGCRTCHSLLAEIPGDRSCSDAGVSPHWCVCRDTVEEPPAEGRAVTDRWAALVVRAVNRRTDLETDLERGYGCAVLSLRSVLYVRRRVNSTEYVVAVETDPGGAQFEATVVQRGSAETVEDTVSRLNEYGVDSHCVRNPLSKLFCYCVDLEAEQEVLFNRLYNFTVRIYNYIFR